MDLVAVVEAAVQAVRAAALAKNIALVSVLEPTLAVTASEGLDLLGAEEFDVVVSDLSMPGADGYALIRRLRELDAAAGRRRPAVALTAHAGPDARQRAFQAGFDAYLVKPVDAKDLTAAVARLLRG